MTHGCIALYQCIFTAKHRHTSIDFLDIVATTLQELGSIALISEVSGPCITREKGYQASRTQGINIFFPDLKNDLSGSYCFGFLVNTNSDNTEPLVHFFSQDPITLQYDITGNCTITSDTIELTIRGSTVTFTGLETGGYKRYQLCTDGSTMTLYDDCGVSQSKSFSHAGFSGTLEGIGVMVDPDLTSLYAVCNALLMCTIYPLLCLFSLQGSVVQFYFLSCTGPDVADMVALQCKSNPLNCSEPVISLAAVVQEYKTHTSPGVSTVCIDFLWTKNGHCHKSPNTNSNT